jgi:hypothetical protein
MTASRNVEGKGPIGRREILRLAAESELDPRTVERAVKCGIYALKTERDQRWLREAATKLGLKLPE